MKRKIDIKRLIVVILYGVIGYLLSKAGVLANSTLFWGVMVAVTAIDVLSYIIGMEKAYEKD